MIKADLHVHTTASDGKLSPAAMIEQAAALGLEAIAITDHDSIEGIAAALESASRFPKLIFIPGVEINTDVADGEVHILGYFIDHKNKKLKHTLEELRNSRYERGRKIVAKLTEMGVNLDWKRVEELADGGSVGRPHIAQAMIDQGLVSSFQEAFGTYIGRNCPAYVQRKKLTPVEAVALVLEGTGLPVLAHPADIQPLESFILELKNAGIIGMEVYYNNYTPQTTDYLQTLADKYDLIACGGSDHHGFDGGAGADIGSVALPGESIEKLVSLANHRREGIT